MHISKLLFNFHAAHHDGVKPWTPTLSRGSELMPSPFHEMPFYSAPAPLIIECIKYNIISLKYAIHYYLNVMENHHNRTSLIYLWARIWKTCVCVFTTVLVHDYYWGHRGGGWVGRLPRPNAHQTSAMSDSLMNEPMHTRPETHLKY